MIKKDNKAKLSRAELAEALYEGTPHLENLAEKLARQHGEAGALCFYPMQWEDIKAFWEDIAGQLIEHSKEWIERNDGCCELSKKEEDRLREKYKIED